MSPLLNSALAAPIMVTPDMVARRAWLIGGALCIVGVAGPLSGRMLLQNIAVLGYAIVLPVAGALTARMFRQVPPSRAAAA